ncbi:MAG: tRNA adenosine(34) deaminase TadA [Erysipelotrichaceae bacterium]
MKVALKEAQKAYDIGEVPVGCVIVKDNKIIARAHNKRETLQQATAHAEILAINKACKKIGYWRLNDCVMYVTLEPCTMCSGAIIQARIQKLYIGATDSKSGAAGSVLNLFEYNFNHKVIIEKNVMKNECQKILKDFFSNLRINKR